MFAKVDGTLNLKNYNGLLQGVYGRFGSTNTSKPLMKEWATIKKQYPNNSGILQTHNVIQVPYL